MEIKAIYRKGKLNSIIQWDFPCGPVVKNPPSNAGDAGSIPGQGTKIPHAVGQLRPAPQRKVAHAAMKISCAATKT